MTNAFIISEMKQKWAALKKSGPSASNHSAAGDRMHYAFLCNILRLPITLLLDVHTARIKPITDQNSYFN